LLHFRAWGCLRILFADFALDRGSRQLFRAGEEIRLGPKAFALLDLLLAERPRAVSKAHIRDVLWPRTAVAESNLTCLVTDLRRTLDDDARRPRFIRTVYAFGYAFCGAVTGPADESPGRGPRGMHPRLLHRGQETALGEGENVLGRAEEALVWIDSPAASRRHARILVREGRATLEDLGSRNGTYLRGQRIHAPTALVDGDEIRIGRVFMTFRSFAAAASTEAEAEP
jgi:DNA-binding winged helix-turn-helix (wHTH) protein